MPSGPNTTQAASLPSGSANEEPIGVVAARRRRCGTRHAGRASVTPQLTPRTGELASSASRPRRGSSSPGRRAILEHHERHGLALLVLDRDSRTRRSDCPGRPRRPRCSGCRSRARARARVREGVGYGARRRAAAGDSPGSAARPAPRGRRRSPTIATTIMISIIVKPRLRLVAGRFACCGSSPGQAAGARPVPGSEIGPRRRSALARVRFAAPAAAPSALAIRLRTAKRLRSGAPRAAPPRRRPAAQHRQPQHEAGAKPARRLAELERAVQLLGQAQRSGEAEPVPCPGGFVVKKGSKIRSRSAVGDAGAVVADPALDGVAALARAAAPAPASPSAAHRSAAGPQLEAHHRLRRVAPPRPRR